MCFSSFLMPGSEGTFTLKSFKMKRILLCLLFVLACLNSCTTTREVRHQMTVHDTLRLNHHDTLHQWSIRHDSVFLHDSIYWQGNQMVSEHWHLQHDTLHSTRVDTLYRSKVQQQTEHTTTQNKTGNNWANALRFLLLGVILGAILMAMKRWK